MYDNKVLLVNAVANMIQHITAFINLSLYVFQYLLIHLFLNLELYLFTLVTP